MGSLPTNYIMKLTGEEGFSSATRTSRRSCPAKSVDDIVLSNRFDTGTEEYEEDVETDFAENPPDLMQSINSTSTVEYEAKKMDWSAMKDQVDREKKERAEKKKMYELAKKASVSKPTNPKKKKNNTIKPMEEETVWVVRNYEIKPDRLTRELQKIAKQVEDELEAEYEAEDDSDSDDPNIHPDFINGRDSDSDEELEKDSAKDDDDESDNSDKSDDSDESDN
ncbi:glutamic acid-rich protein-like [Papaver somniferum]|uniref:glutamic acid-rich protein-like n=1 Tax=Papaver somniferum TaxID=3469 RepID=UPI000E703AD1|nr:glutamic acid-rich protein-like [Papaver somniferum]